MAKTIKGPFTPLEKASDFNRRLLPIKADGGFQPEADPPLAEMPPSANTVRERSSLTGFTKHFGNGYGNEARIVFRLRLSALKNIFKI